MTAFDPARFTRLDHYGHGGRLGIRYHAKAEQWVELALPYAAGQIGDASTGILASGPILTLMDMATSMAVWTKRGVFAPHATLDLRVDYLRPATPGETVIGRGECYRLSRSVAFVRGIAYHADPDDPVAHVAGTFMLMNTPAEGMGA